MTSSSGRSRATAWLARLVGRVLRSPWSRRAAVAASPMPVVVLYTRQGCHLCDQALEILQRQGLAVTLVDIDQDPALRARYDCCVPVVEIDGRVRFRGRANEVLLRRLLTRLGSMATQGETAGSSGAPQGHRQYGHG